MMEIDLRKEIADIVWRARAYPGDKTPEQVADKIMAKVLVWMDVELADIAGDYALPDEGDEGYAEAQIKLREIDHVRDMLRTMIEGLSSRAESSTADKSTIPADATRRTTQKSDRTR